MFQSFNAPSGAPPGSLGLSPAAIAENLPAGTVVGQLSASDPDAGDVLSYALVSGTRGTDNALFAVVGDELRLAAAMDEEEEATRRNIFSLSAQPGGRNGKRRCVMNSRTVFSGILPDQLSTDPDVGFFDIRTRSMTVNFDELNATLALGARRRRA